MFEFLSLQSGGCKKIHYFVWIFCTDHAMSESTSWAYAVYAAAHTTMRRQEIHDFQSVDRSIVWIFREILLSVLELFDPYFNWRAKRNTYSLSSVWINSGDDNCKSNALPGNFPNKISYGVYIRYCLRRKWYLTPILPASPGMTNRCP